MTEQQIVTWFSTSEAPPCPLDADVRACGDAITHAIAAYVETTEARRATVATACAALAGGMSAIADDDAERAATELRLVSEAADVAITTENATEAEEARTDVRAGMRRVLWIVRAGWRCTPGVTA